MTARVLDFPDPMGGVWAALDKFDQIAEETFGIPVRVVNALRSPDAVTVPITVGGVPVTLSTGPGALPRAELRAVWVAMCAAAPAAGSQIHTAGGRVLVDLPNTLGGVA